MKSGDDTTTAHTAAVEDIEVHYTRAGDGPAVVLVHGLAQDHRSWAAVQEGLPHLRTYAYDLRGHGRTTLGTSDGTLDQLRDDLLAFLENITGPSVCVGFSLGGTVVLSAAAARPDLVRQAVVMGTSSVVGRAAAGFYSERIELFRGTDRAAQAAALRADTAAALHTSRVDVDEETRKRIAAVGAGDGYINASAAMASLAGKPLTPQLSAITAQTPVTVIGAEHDTFCPRKAADIILGAIEHADYREIAEAGHLMLIDQPDRTVKLLAHCIEK